jgi:hypothetical protein
VFLMDIGHIGELVFECRHTYPVLSQGNRFFPG